MKQRQDRAKGGCGVLLAENFRLLEDRNLRGPPAMTEYRHDAAPSIMVHRGRKSGERDWPTRQVRPLPTVGAVHHIAWGGRGGPSIGDVRGHRRGVDRARATSTRAKQRQHSRTDGRTDGRTSLPWRGPSTRGSGMQRATWAPRKRTAEERGEEEEEMEEQEEM